MKQFILSILIVLLGLTSANAQTDSSENQEQLQQSLIAKQPEYPGGPAAMYEYIQNNINYPIRAMEEDVEARVVIRFVIDKTGDVEEVMVAQYTITPNDSIGELLAPLFTEEALRIVREMPKWTPGKQRGKAVKVRLALPISFKL